MMREIAQWSERVQKHLFCLVLNMEKIKFRGIFLNKEIDKRISIFSSDEENHNSQNKIVKGFWNRNEKIDGFGKIHYKTSTRSFVDELSNGFNKLLLTTSQYEESFGNEDEFDESFRLEGKPLSGIFEQIKTNA